MRIICYFFSKLYNLEIYSNTGIQKPVIEKMVQCSFLNDNNSLNSEL